MKMKIVAIVVLIYALIAIALPKPEHNFEETTYAVKAGDNLWRIASDYCPNTMDKRDYIRLVKERNNLTDSVIYPGQSLIVYQPQS